jgi:hypothetical protein
MGQEIIVPQGFQAPSQAFAKAGLVPGQQSLADGIGQSYGVISYRSQHWSLRYRGQKYFFTRADDGTPASYLDVIILDDPGVKSKSYFTKFDPNNPEGERPLCSSMDGVTPDPDSPQVQCNACSLCPRNVWKTDANGKKGRECQDYKRLAVLLMPAVTEKMLGAKLMEPVFLRVPPASLNSLARLGEWADGCGYHFSSFITRITFDPDKSWPEMIFRPIQGLSDAEAPVVIAMRDDPLVKRIIHGDRSAAGPILVAASTPKATTRGLSSQAIQPAASTGSAPATPALSPTTLDLTATRTVVDKTASPLPTNTSAPPVTPAAPQASPASEPVVTGFGGVTPAAPTAPASSQTVGSPTPAPQNPADVGEPEESDAELDAQIASILAKPIGTGAPVAQ